MREEEIKNLAEKQRAYFYTGETLSLEKRIQALKRLKQAITDREEKIKEISSLSQPYIICIV